MRPCIRDCREAEIRRINDCPKQEVVEGSEKCVNTMND